MKMYRYKYLIDTSYLIYHAAFSAFNSYVYYNDIPASQQTQDLDPTIDQQFCHVFQKRFVNNLLIPLQQIFPLVDKSQIVFCMDCPRKTVWRRQIYPEYKISRDLQKSPQLTKFDVGKVFKYAYSYLVPKLCEEYNSIKVFHQLAQGDDIIATLLSKYLEQSEMNRVVILSGDRDMVQLAGDRVSITTIEGNVRTPTKQMQTLVKKRMNRQITAGQFLLFKIILGDPSDNIPNIKSKIGPKKAFQLAMDTQKLKQLLKSDHLIAESFLRNKKLISMKQIPQYIITEINQLVDSQVQSTVTIF